MLEAVANDRSLLAQLPDEERRRLLIAAGRTVHPEVEQKRRLVKALRRAQAAAASRRTTAPLLAATGIREAREAERLRPARRGCWQAAAPRTSRRARCASRASCYVCKAEYRRLHAFYDALCPECAELNYEKRFQTADLHGPGRARHRARA